MPPTLILIRHAQAEHNATKDYNIPDPHLTPLGYEQAARLSTHLQTRLPPDLLPDLILVSPFRRTLQTAAAAFSWDLDPATGAPRAPMVAHAGWQENSDRPADTGLAPALVAPLYPHVDFSRLDPVYPDKTSPAGAHYHHTRPAVLARAQACLRELRARPERVIAVVSHSAFMRLAVTGCWYENADYRIFDFADELEGDEGPLRLVQWEETLAGGMGLSLTKPAVLGSGIPEAVQARDTVPRG